MKTIVLLSMLLSLGLVSQATQEQRVASAAIRNEVSAETAVRLKRLIRANAELPPKVEIILEPQKSSEFPGYNLLPVTFSDGSNSRTYDFLISKDNQKLLRLEPMEDIQQKISFAERPSRGARNPSVTIVVFDDFQCPSCSTNHAHLFNEVMKEYGDKVRVYYKDYPLVEIHPWADHAAVNANCLALQSHDAFWDFADYVHPNARQITGKGRPLAEQVADLDNKTAEIGQARHLDMTKLQTCVKAQDDSVVKASLKEGHELGVHATPTLFINGQMSPGAPTPDELRSMLDRDLRDAGVTPPVHAAKARPEDSAKPETH